MGNPALCSAISPAHREDRLLVVNLGTGLDLPNLPEPLVAPPADCDWQVQWSSEWPVYGGSGSSLPGRFGAWHVPGECTLLLVPVVAERPFAPDAPKSGASVKGMRDRRVTRIRLLIVLIGIPQAIHQGETWKSFARQS